MAAPGRSAAAAAAYALALVLHTADVAGAPRIDAVVPHAVASEGARALRVEGAELPPVARAALLGGGPRRVGEAVFPGALEVRGVAHAEGPAGPLAVVAFHEASPFKSGGLRILDLSDPGRPRLAGAYVWPDITGLGVVVDGTRAVLLSRNVYTMDGALHEVDIADPAAPREVAVHFFDVWPERLAGDGTTLAVATSGASPAVLLFDVADLARPRRSVPLGGPAWDVALAGGRAYATWWGDTGGGGLTTFALDGEGDALDVELPGLPLAVAEAAGRIHVGLYHDDGSASLWSGVPGAGDTPSLLALPGPALSARADGARLYLAAGGDGVLVADLAHGAVALAGRFRDATLTAWDLDVPAPGRVLVADHYAGLEILDLTHPAPPAPLATLALPGAARDVALSGTLVAIAAGDAGLVLADVADPTAPGARGTLAPLDSANAVAARGATVFVAENYGGLVAVDASDSGAPVELARLFTDGPALDVALDGTLAVVAQADAGLAVVDAADPARLVRLGQVVTGGTAQGVALSGARAALADGRRGLHVVDLSDPGRPRIAASARSCAGLTIVAATDVAFLSAARVVLAADTQGLFVFDLAGDALSCAAHVNVPARAVRLAVGDAGAVHVAGPDTGVLTFDLADLSSPAPLARHVVGRAGGLAAHGGLLYVASEEAALVVHRLDPRPGSPHPPAGALPGTALEFALDGPLTPGPYDVALTGAGGAALAPNGLVVCPARRFEITLTPVLDPSSGRVRVPLSWRLRVDDAGASASAWLVLPEGESRPEWPRLGPLALGDVELRLDRRPVAGGTASRVSFRLREDGRLAAAVAEGSAADLLFDVVATDGAGCPASTRVSFHDALAELCRAAGAARADLALPCAGANGARRTSR